MKFLSFLFYVAGGVCFVAGHDHAALGLLAIAFGIDLASATVPKK